MLGVCRYIWKEKGRGRKRGGRESNDHCLNRNLRSKRLQGPPFGVICAVWGAGIWAWIRWQLRLRPLSARSPLGLKVKGPLAQIPWHAEMSFNRLIWTPEPCCSRTNMAMSCRPSLVGLLRV
jgi:hypothetical protein